MQLEVPLKGNYHTTYQLHPMISFICVELSISEQCLELTQYLQFWVTF